MDKSALGDSGAVSTTGDLCLAFFVRHTTPVDKCRRGKRDSRVGPATRQMEGSPSLDVIVNARPRVSPPHVEALKRIWANGWRVERDARRRRLDKGDVEAGKSARTSAVARRPDGARPGRVEASASRTRGGCD